MFMDLIMEMDRRPGGPGRTLVDSHPAPVAAGVGRCYERAFDEFTHRDPGSALIRKADDFPEPEVVLPNGTRLWRQDVALKWLDDHPRRSYRRNGGGS